MGNGLKLGRIAGIDIIADWSLLIIFVLVLVSLGAGLIPAWHPDWSAALIWGTALAAAVILFASVLVHELSHAVVGRARGMEIRRIVLFVFGGMAQFEREPHAWRAELWMAAVGPITSLVLGIAMLLAASTGLDPEVYEAADPREALEGLGAVTTLLLWAGQVNILLALFNLVPGFPLDGGRVLRAILWGVTGDLVRATRWASTMGQMFAWFLIGMGVAMMLGVRVPVFGTGLVSGLWLAFIGWFLNNAALLSYRQILIKETLEDVPVGRVMLTDVVSVDAATSVDRFVDEYLMRRDQRAYPVLENGRLAGLVCFSDVRGVDRDTWSERTVADIMTPAERLTRLAPSDDASEALSVLGRGGINQLPVVENGEVRGLVRREDILKWLSLHGDDDLSPIARV